MARIALVAVLLVAVAVQNAAAAPGPSPLPSPGWDPIGSIFSGAKKLVTGALDSVGTGIGGVLKTVKSLGSGNLGTVIETAANAISDTTRTTYDNAADVVKNVAKAVGAEKVAEKVTDIGRDLAGQVLNAGETILGSRGVSLDNRSVQKEGE